MKQDHAIHLKSWNILTELIMISIVISRRKLFFLFISSAQSWKSFLQLQYDKIVNNIMS